MAKGNKMKLENTQKSMNVDKVQKKRKKRLSKKKRSLIKEQSIGNDAVDKSPKVQNNSPDGLSKRARRKLKKKQTGKNESTEELNYIPLTLSPKTKAANQFSSSKGKRESTPNKNFNVASIQSVPKKEAKRERSIFSSCSSEDDEDDESNDEVQVNSLDSTKNDKDASKLSKKNAAMSGIESGGDEKVPSIHNSPFSDSDSEDEGCEEDRSSSSVDTDAKPQKKVKGNYSQKIVPDTKGGFKITKSKENNPVKMKQSKPQVSILQRSSGTVESSEEDCSEDENDSTQDSDAEESKVDAKQFFDDEAEEGEETGTEESDEENSSSDRETEVTTASKRKLNTSKEKDWEVGEVSPPKKKMHETPEEDFKVFINGIDKASTEEMLMEALSKHASVKSLVLPKNKYEPNEVKGFAFVVLEDRESFQKILGLDKNLTINDMPLNIRPYHTEGRDSFGRGRGGEGGRGFRGGRGRGKGNEVWRGGGRGRGFGRGRGNDFRGGRGRGFGRGGNSDFRGGRGGGFEKGSNFRGGRGRGFGRDGGNDFRGGRGRGRGNQSRGGRGGGKRGGFDESREKHQNGREFKSEIE